MFPVKTGRHALTLLASLLSFVDEPSKLGMWHAMEQQQWTSGLLVVVIMASGDPKQKPISPNGLLVPQTEALSLEHAHHQWSCVVYRGRGWGVGVWGHAHTHVGSQWCHLRMTLFSCWASTAWFGCGEPARAGHWDAVLHCSTECGMCVAVSLACAGRATVLSGGSLQLPWQHHLGS